MLFLTSGDTKTKKLDRSRVQAYHETMITKVIAFSLYGNSLKCNNCLVSAINNE